MYVKQMQLKGFRNFKECTVVFTEKSLIMGPNDVGKTNLLYALRLLLDRSLSEADLEPKDSDFFAHDDTDEFEILVEFEDVDADCVRAKLKENIGEDGTLWLGYRGIRDPVTRSKKHTLLAGRSKATMEPIESRFYLRVLNLKYIGSKRDLAAFIKQQRRYLFQEAREQRSPEAEANDSAKIQEITSNLEKVGTGIKSLSFVATSTDRINQELHALSVHNATYNVVFETGAADPLGFIDDLEMAAQVNGKALMVGGDGRTNQIHLALWATRNHKQEAVPLEVSIFCIEEPEAHLHPHQQRKLADYLVDVLKSQVIITTHSPQITCQFPPASIIRLYQCGSETQAAGNGCNPFTEAALIDFGYRLNIIPAEAFFADAVLLVEGPSEELFYKALGSQIGIDLDRYNISILMVGGIGFEVYTDLLSSLQIKYVIRTDNDIIKVPKREEWRFAGVQRAISAATRAYGARVQVSHEDELLLQGFASETPPDINRDAANRIISELRQFDVFLSTIDLEHDLYAALRGELEAFFTVSPANLVAEMKKRKATFMFQFLRSNKEALQKLADSALAVPLIRCKEILESDPA